MDNILNNILKNYKQWILNPATILIAIILFFYLTWLALINPLLNLYHAGQRSNQKLAEQVAHLKNSIIQEPQNLEKLLIEKFPTVTRQFQTTNKHLQLTAKIKSAAIAVSILDAILANNIPIVKNFTLRPHTDSSDLELVINFN